MRNLGALVGIPAILIAAAACDGDTPSGQPSPTPRPLPSPVAIAQQPEPGFTLADPALEPLPGATVESGYLGGTAYQIEMPDDWNGRLVMYMHGNDTDTTLRVYPPDDRRYLIRSGYAWASSSYSVNVFVVNGLAADETAALWDHFVARHGRPERTYAMGISMGGAAAVVTAERYADRYDGALALCPDAPPTDVNTDWFVIAAFAAGVTQAEFDASDPAAIIGGRIRPALRDPAVRRRFEDIWIDRSGGPRPFDRKAMRVNEEQMWIYAVGNATNPSVSNDTKVYELGPTAGVSSDEFNSGVIRFTGDPARNKYAANNAVTGALQVPLMTVQTTGDNLTVFSESQEIRRRVETAGTRDLLVQRAIQSPGHCDLTHLEFRDSFEDLVAWVEDGDKPDGEDLLGDVSNAGATFTSAPRIDSEDSERVGGAADRVVLSGRATIDGEAIAEGFLWAVVDQGGFMTTCSYEFPVFADGRYEIAIAAASEVEGCVEPGATVFLQYFRDGENYLSERAIDAPAAGSRAEFDGLFSSGRPAGFRGDGDLRGFHGTSVFGELLDASGRPMPAGTRVEAYIGGVLCGRSTTPPIVMAFTEPSLYAVDVARPERVAGCTGGEPIELRVNGATVAADLRHDFTGHYVDLWLP